MKSKSSNIQLQNKMKQSPVDALSKNPYPEMPAVADRSLEIYFEMLIFFEILK